MKKLVILLVLATVIAGSAFAQKGGEVKNFISGEASLLGAGVRYERMLTPNWSIGGDVFFHSFFLFWNSLGIQASGRFYPWAGMFYAELGLGFGWVSGTEKISSGGYSANWIYSTTGFMVTPGVGWKIDVGDTGGFFINPFISFPIVFGSRSYDGYLSGYGIEDGSFKVGINVRPGIGLGYCF